MDGYFQFDNIYLDNKDIILKFIEKNKNNHYIQTDRNDKFLIKDIIDDILLPVDKIYDIVIHIRLGDFNGIEDYIEYKYLEKLLNDNISMFINKKIAIVSEKLKLEKDIEYLNKILNFFKSNNNIYSPVVETNDLITDFNIMKQCKVLICSMSTLSWCAAYLSKKIKLCIMPNYNFYKIANHKNCFFKKPIINTIFYDTYHTKFNDLKIIILTLKNFKERTNSINNLLIKLSMIGITYEIVYGIYGKDIKVYDTEDENIKLLYHNFETYYYDKTKRLNKHIMKAGELGCAWSHLNIYKKLCSDKLYNKYLIFEDDACLSENLDTIYNTLNNLPNIFDICHICLSDWYPFNKTDKVNDYFYNVEKKFFNRLTAYIISKEGALKVLKYSNNYINIPCDDLICDSFINNDDFKLYVPQNYLFKENIGNISITEKINNL
jgi:GR25 family glycosyltransferase involved in LPS biosynthesis